MWEQAITNFTTWLRAGGRSEATISLRRAHLRQLAAEVGRLNPWAVTGHDLVRWTGTKHWAQETRRSWRSTLSTFYAWGQREGHLSASPVDALPVVRRTRPHPKPAPADVVADAKANASRRERLAIRLAEEAGLRRGEIVQVHDRDIARDLLGWSLRVHGKGAKDRDVPLTDSLARDLLAACDGGWAFPGKVDGHLSAQRMGDLLRGVLLEASGHQLRHRFAQLAYSVDRDLGTVQDLLGHASPETTRHYVAPPAEWLRQTIEAVALMAA